MNSLVSINKQHQSITTSRIVAETFEKNHSHVLRDIRELHCSDGLSSYQFWFNGRNERVTTRGSNKK